MYSEDIKAKVLALILEGLTPHAAARRVGISDQTVYTWMPEFRQAGLTLSREGRLSRVAEKAMDIVEAKLDDMLSDPAKVKPQDAIVYMGVIEDKLQGLAKLSLSRDISDQRSSDLRSLMDFIRSEHAAGRRVTDAIDGEYHDVDVDDHDHGHDALQQLDAPELDALELAPPTSPPPPQQPSDLHTTES